MEGPVCVIKINYHEEFTNETLSDSNDDMMEATSLNVPKQGPHPGTRIWRRLQKTCWVFFWLCFIILHYFLIVALTFWHLNIQVDKDLVKRRKYEKEHYLTYAFTLGSLYWYLWKRNALKKDLKDLFVYLKSLDENNMKKQIKRMKLGLAISTVYFVILIVIPFYYTVVNPKYRNISKTTMTGFCLGCNTKGMPDWLQLLLVVSINFLFVISVHGIIILFTLTYCFIATLLSDLLDTTNDILSATDMSSLPSGTLESSEVNISVFTKAHSIIEKSRRLTNTFNKHVQYFVLAWCTVSILKTSRGVVWIIEVTGAEEFGLEAYKFPLFFQHPLSLVLISLLAAQVWETSQRIILKLNELSHEAYRMGINHEIQILLNQVKHPFFGIQIGGCFVMTKSLLVSFLGLGITYVVVFIQLSPDVLSKIQSINKD